MIRPTAVAGTFYPSNPHKLRDMVAGFLRTARGEANFLPKAIIGPHAGYIYSGAIAGSAYAPVGALHETVTQVILLGPSHTMYLNGIAASSALAFATPLGNVPVDQSALQSILDLPQVQMLDAAHEREHGLEVHLPFLQAVLNEFAIVPLVVGDVTTTEVADVLGRLWGGTETLIAISSDLSHYLPYQAAQEMDLATAVAIESYQPEKLGDNSACGRNPIKGLLHESDQRNLRVQRLDLRNSGDTAGPKNRVVGYGAWIFG